MTAEQDIAAIADGGDNPPSRVRTALTSVLVMPAAKAVRDSTNQAIPTTTATPIEFETEVFDNDGIVDLGTSASRFTVQTAGVYAIYAGMRMETNTTGERIFTVLKNGTDQIVRQSWDLPGTTNMAANISVLDEASVNDFYEAEVFQNSGNPRNILADVMNFLAIVRVA